jgi:hypothetical protein
LTGGGVASPCGVFLILHENNRKEKQNCNKLRKFVQLAKYFLVFFPKMTEKPGKKKIPTSQAAQNMIW